MSLLTGIRDFIGLDIGTTAVRIVQLSRSGNTFSLVRYGSVMVDSKLVLSDAKSDQQKLAFMINELITKTGIDTKNAAVGLPSQKVFTTVVEFDNLKDDELGKTIYFQADAVIPTPIDQSKIDWARLGPSAKEVGKVEVLLTSVANTYIEQRLGLLESIGLNVVAFEPDSIALTRALSVEGTANSQLIVDIGKTSTDLVVVTDGAPHLVRSIPTGTEAVIRSAMQNLNTDEKQAMQFVFKFGLSKDKLDGQVYNAIFPTLDILVGEIEKTIKFFNSRYTNTGIDRIIMAGDASVLPEFPLFVANRFGLGVEIGNAWRNVAVPSDRQNELSAISNHFGVAVGLAERIE